MIEYLDGLHELRDGCHAWLELPGTWGMSNAGVVVGGDEILVVDTRNDVPRAQALRDAVAELSPTAAVTTVVNSHADGDHWYGNFAFSGARIIATEEAAAAMRQLELDPRRLREVGEPTSALRRWALWRSEQYDYTAWQPHYPTETFSGIMTIDIGGRSIDLIQVGPAHTDGDAIVHVRDAGVVYAGDIVFNQSTPIAWSGPVGRYVEACDRVLDLDCDVIVPGHGPIANREDVERQRQYLIEVLEHATGCFRAGLPAEVSYRQFANNGYGNWLHASRVYQTIQTIYGELNPGREGHDRLSNLEQILADDGWTPNDGYPS